ncbi:MAG TPA: immunoglobulin domain-containing protein, partial [Candidatus Eisenbacteria bacterium]
MIVGFAASNARAQATILSGNTSTSTAGTSHQQGISDNPNASLSGLISQDPFGNEASANGTLAALDGRFKVRAHACSGGGPGSGGSANAIAQCQVTLDYKVVSTTLPAGTPVTIRINWAVSGRSTAAGNLTHYISGAIGTLNGHVSITVGGVSIINRSGERRHEYNLNSGYTHPVFGTLNPEADSLTHVVTALVGQNVRIFMSGSAAGNSVATLSSVTDGDAQLAMVWGISSMDPNASVESVNYMMNPAPPASNATLPMADDYKDPRPPGLQQCFEFSSQPGPVSVCASSNTGFSVSATGTGPFTYRWYRNGVPVDAIANPSATTANLVLNGVNSGQGGNYTVKVTNPCGDR